MVDYVRLQKVALRLTTKYGRTLKLVKHDRTIPDPARPWKTIANPAGTGAEKVTIKGVFVPPNTVRQFGLTALGQGSEIEDMVANSENIIIFFPEDTLDVRQFQEVLDGAETWGIIAAQILRPGDLKLLGFLGVKR